MSQQLYAIGPAGRPGPAVGPATGNQLRLQLLGGFRLEVAGTRVALPTHAKRVQFPARAGAGRLRAGAFGWPVES